MARSGMEPQAAVAADHGAALTSRPVMEDLGPGLVLAPAALLHRWQAKIQCRVQQARTWDLHGGGSVQPELGSHLSAAVQSSLLKLHAGSLQGGLDGGGESSARASSSSVGLRPGALPHSVDRIATAAWGGGGGGGGGGQRLRYERTASPALAEHWRPALGEAEGEGAEEEEEESERSRRAERPARGEGSSVPLCAERVGGLKKQYFVRVRLRKGKLKEEFEAVDSDQRPGPLGALINFAKSYVLPEGYPESVSLSYTPYMQWRAVQYFFGGAMSVFTTRSLLHALGVSRGGAASGALAVNWVIKDGAGRVGKMLFARHGKRFDCDLKQFRFAGDLLMEVGAGVELATMALPRFFLPLACAANVAKNIAAVTATSTRAPIYKAFARRENIGDVTAKGESVSNLADLLGTGLGIALARRGPPLAATFCVLSCGYLLGSYREVRAVHLPTLNRARFAVAVRTFLQTGRVPPLAEVNQQEAILVMPWASEQPLQLGVSVAEAFPSPEALRAAQRLFQDERYLVAYRPGRRRAYVVLKEGATSEHVLQAAFQAHVLLHTLQEAAQREGGRGRIRTLSEAEVAESCRRTRTLFSAFRAEAAVQGWTMAESLLNPGEVRLCT